MIDNVCERKRMGANFLGLLNDLKRRPEDAAKELEVSLEYINKIIQGEKEISQDLVNHIIKKWPINARDLYLIHDDCPTGIKIMRAEESKKTSRIMNRGGYPYYEYRDTVMSSVSLFRPEWIEELCIVGDNNPNNPDIQWNNGHFMHQFTYFIGDVNYYYIGKEGGKKVLVTNTGDSVYGTPFRPHTFTTRKGASKNGLILALTYGNKLAADTQQELAAIGKELGIQFHLDFSSREKAFASLLKFYMDSTSITLSELEKRTKIPRNLLESFLNGDSKMPEYSELELLAKALNVNIRDILPPDKIEDKVIARYYKDAPRWFYPENTRVYEIVELVHSQNLPNSKALEITTLKTNSDNDLDLKVGLHQYIYNVGETEIKFNWQFNGKINLEIIRPNDSLYIKPFVMHNFRGSGKLMVLRIGSRIAGDAQREFSNLDKNDAIRAIEETQMWFDPEGKN